MSMIKNPVRGMRDFTPTEMGIRDYVLKIIEEVATSSGYQKIETPAVEHLENLTGNDGGENESLIFRILKRSQDLEKAEESGDELSDSGLRYDLTVPLARFFSNNKQDITLPFKALQIGSVWRADRPQKGRFRQFVQCDLDILGDDSILAEIDTISTIVNMLNRIFEGTKISGITVNLNDRKILTAAARYAGFKEDDYSSILIELDKIDKIGLSGVRDGLIKLNFDSQKVDTFINLFENLSGGIEVRQFCSKFGEFSPDDSVINDLEKILETLEKLMKGNSKIIFDPTLVRGMGYYTGPIFECSIEEFPSSIAGGGRYDNMIGKFDGGSSVSACGFSIGFERVVSILEEVGFKPKTDKQMTAILVDKEISNEKLFEIFDRAEKMRAEGTVVSIISMNKNLGYQIEMLEKSGYTSFDKVYKDN